MGKRYLIDTNVIIDFSANQIPRKGKIFVAKYLDSRPIISIITKIELLSFSFVSKEIEELVAVATVEPLTEEIAERAIIIRKQSNLKIPDAIIAATCVEKGFTLITRNLSDFGKVKNLSSIDLYRLK